MPKPARMLTQTSSLDDVSGSPPGATRTEQLSHILEMLTRTPAVRTELVDDINHQLADGGYMSEEKLDLAISRMLKDILR